MIKTILSELINIVARSSISWRWFSSKALRVAVEDHKQIVKLLAAQRDLIKPARITELEKSLAELDKQCRGPIDKEALRDARKNALDTADRVLIPYPNAWWRDWAEMFLVVAALVLAFRTFFFQPFKIPTGSMQPTLYGITVENLMDRVVSNNVTGRVEEGMFVVDDDFFLLTENDGRKRLRSLQGHTVTFKDGQKVKISEVLDSKRAKLDHLMKTKSIKDQPFTIYFEDWPDNLGYATEWFRGFRYHSMQAEGNWKFESFEEPQTIIPLISKQVLVFRDIDSDETILRTAWLPPFDSYQKPELYNHVFQGQIYNKDNYIYRLRVKTGDHLFVNRITYNFRHPKRGDISVFTIKSTDVTHGHSGLPSKDTFYIKRLVGLGGQKITIGPDRHLRVNGRRLSSADRGLEFVYSHPKDSNRMPIYPSIKSAYSGHRLENDHLGPDLSRINSPYTVPKNHYLFFGDNTSNSMDSRSWGALPKENVIGLSSFVYWPPLSPRFGWSHR